MPRRIVVELTAEQRAELVETLIKDPKAYMRERAAAILKVADGVPVKEVAEHRLLVTRTEDSVYFWLKRYREEGLAGLRNKEGRGRKPAFSPSGPERPARGRPRRRTTASGTGDTSAGDTSAGDTSTGDTSAAPGAAD